MLDFLQHCNITRPTCDSARSGRAVVAHLTADMAPSTTSTFTIQPWTSEPSNTNDLRDVLSRAQRGHLRDITESSLQEEIATEGALEFSSEASESDVEEDEDADTSRKQTFPKPSTREDLYNARRYMLAAARAAQQEVGISLDLMSLIVSKDLPKQAQATMGATIKEKVPLGTMGVDFWQRMPVDQAREAQDALLAANVKMSSLQNSADSLLGAAKRMEENVRRETQYWDQILSISSRGWNVCRVPGQQHRLGVRFGFSESAPQFSRKGIAALNPDREGGIRLERGIGSKPRALRAVLRKQGGRPGQESSGGRVVGVSRVPAVQDAEETTLESRIRHARDSLFDEELFHEIIRESRTLTSLGVAIDGSTVRLRNISSNATGPDGLEISLDLVSLDEDNSLAADHENDSLAQATVLAARLLLSQAHRDRLRKRSEPPPPMSEKQKDERPVLPVLRPIMSLMLHSSALEQLNGYLATVASTLRAAKIEHAIQQAQLSLPDGDEQATAEKLLTTTLLRPLTSSASLTITPPPASSTDGSSTADASYTNRPQPLNLRLDTSLAHSFGPVFTLHQPSGKAMHFPDFTSFSSAMDAEVAAALARALLPLVQTGGQSQEWKVREGEAVLEKDVGVGEAEQGFAVYLDCSKGELGMQHSGLERRTCHWRASQQPNASEDDEEGRGEGFWDAARSCLS